MKKIYNLNGHSINDVAAATKEFLTHEGFNGMVTELLKEGNGYRIMAEDLRNDLLAKAAGGDTKCEVLLKPLDNDRIEVIIGKGSWGGKVFSIVAFAALCILFPLGVLVAIGYIIAGMTIYTAAKIDRQNKLSARVDQFIYQYLNQK